MTNREFIRDWDSDSEALDAALARVDQLEKALEKVCAALAVALDTSADRIDKLEKALREIEERHMSTAGVRGTDAEIARAALAALDVQET